ncbi:MAG TPA: hypothetical protein VMU59_12525 [Caulobacteraceae bacterium]|nr:hypothetical protein [Caulobacteraceae bacterium]
MDEPIELAMPRQPLRASERYALDADVLTHRVGRRERRWPLATLRRVTVGVRRSPYAPPLPFVRLTFARPGIGGAVLTIARRSGVQGYGRFVRALAEAAAVHAPQARFESLGGRATSGLIGLAILLSAGVLAMGVAAAMAGLAPLGLDLAARLVFLLILIMALLPWIARSGARRLDPRALPQDLVDP